LLFIGGELEKYVESDYVRQRKKSATNPEADSFHWLYSYFSLSVGGCGERHEYEPVIFLY
jgi:hypothetical protein